jgi:hypothetical protein
MVKILRIAVVTALLLTANAAWAASGSDPNDTQGGIDILRSSVQMVTLEDGHHRLVLRTTTQRKLRLETGKGSIYWQLDTKGTGHAEYEVYVFGDPEANDPAGPIFCLLQRPNGADKTYLHAVNVFDDGDTFGARCAIPKTLLDIDGAIRWRLAGRLDGVIDRAPDVGWYGG